MEYTNKGDHSIEHFSIKKIKQINFCKIVGSEKLCSFPEQGLARELNTELKMTEWKTV